MLEKTLVLLKPDTIVRGLVGVVISRIERVGMKIIAAKMLQPDADLINKHYPPSRKELLLAMGNATLKNNRQAGIDTKAVCGTDDPEEIGRLVQKWNVEFLSSGPVWAMVVEGPQAISIVRKLRGATLPADATPGTINGDFSFDSANVANYSQRAVRNLMHASGNPQEADMEINLWFKPHELLEPSSINQRFMLS